MNIIIPMAGLGERFSKAGFTLPKPLIPVVTKAMYRHATDCLPLDQASNVIFILRESEFSAQLKQDIEHHYPSLNYKILILAYQTRGQAETVLASAPHLDLNVPTLIHNCDTYVKNQFNWSSLMQEEIDGAIILFPSQESRWSYAEVSGEHIIDFQEKKVISNHASTGTYYYRNTTQLLTHIEHIIRHNIRENNEFYLSTVYQLMLKENKNIKPLWAETMLCFGTPQDLVDSLNRILIEGITL